MIQVRDGLAPIPETSIMNYHMLMENQRDLKSLEERRNDKPNNLRMVWVESHRVTYGWQWLPVHGSIVLPF